jgi:acyl-CoA thioester hydrolase
MRLPIHARYPDYDTKGHVNNAVYLTYFEIARAAAWLERVQGDPDFPFVIAEATIRYVSEAMIGDPLEIEIATTEVRTRAWVWSYRLVRPPDDRLVAEGRTVQVMFDYDTRAPAPIPDEVKTKLWTV